MVLIEAESTAAYSLRVERTFAAPRDKVFRVWIDSEAVKQWFIHGAPVHWSQAPAIDARRGGHYSWSVASDDNNHEVFAFHGKYHEVKRGRKLVLSWEWQTLPIEGVESPGNTLLTIEFLEKGRTTKVVLTQTGLPGEEARNAHDKGWKRCFDGMEKLLSGKLGKSCLFLSH
jgi:uncharacterized protein YndB with AHSA1/START domain